MILAVTFLSVLKVILIIIVALIVLLGFLALSIIMPLLLMGDIDIDELDEETINNMYSFNNDIDGSV